MSGNIKTGPLFFVRVGSEVIPADPLGGKKYRLRADPSKSGKFRYGDVVEVCRDKRGSLVAKKLIMRPCGPSLEVTDDGREIHVSLGVRIVATAPMSAASESGDEYLARRLYADNASARAMGARETVIEVLADAIARWRHGSV